MPASESTSTPTARSPQLLMRILGIYPILRTIISFGHQSNISHLAKTCPAINSLLNHTISSGRLHKPYSLCTKDTNHCYVCHTIVCEDCRVDLREQERPSEIMARYGYKYAVVSGRSPTLRQELLAKLQAVLPVRAHTTKKQKIIQNYLCQVCSNHPWPRERKPVSETKPEWVPESLVTEEKNLKLASTQGFRRIIIPILEWDDIPDMDTMCTCGGFDTRCQAEPHLVRVERLPTKSEWAGLVLQPKGITWQFGSNRDVMLEAISPYLTRLVDNVHIPFYVVDEVREPTTGVSEISSSS
ncbi:hypothetical protein L211DRAFT_853529 [Terfezia boudieri ATCC MYA-4762]|uniref:Uncharacterized protein n=1 Tax=Terfezia boudieri ATCC MYA-4762 TaxID=1051890 RepID=A0A3N4L848_9PEZI|nr:hypothetical protein L211DRAFT_853529 [Terfezia boudieri ATCC MYA-4762]